MPDGNFAAVVVGTLRLPYFDDLFRKLTLGPRSTIGLLRTDGIMLTRLRYDRAAIGRSLADTTLLEHLDPSSHSGTFEAMVSMSIACIMPDARAIHQDLPGVADRALFDAKQGGRNRVVAAPLPPGLATPRLVA